MTKDYCLHSSNIQSIFKILTEIVGTGKRYRLSIKIWADKRSINQNSLSHMWYEDIAKQANKREKTESFTCKSVKEDFKKMFLGYEEVEHTSVINNQKTYTHELVKTSSLDTASMHEFLQKVEAWAYQNGFTLIIPNNSEYRELKNKQES